MPTLLEFRRFRGPISAVPTEIPSETLSLANWIGVAPVAIGAVLVACSG